MNTERPVTSSTPNGRGARVSVWVTLVVSILGIAVAVLGTLLADQEKSAAATATMTDMRFSSVDRQVCDLERRTDRLEGQYTEILAELRTLRGLWEREFGAASTHK